MFSRSLLPSYALEAARRTTPIQEDDNLIQLESQATGFATVQTTFAVGETKTINLMDQTMEMAALDDVDDASAVQATPVISPVMATIPLAAEIRQETEVVVKPVLASRGSCLPFPSSDRLLTLSSLAQDCLFQDPLQTDLYAILSPSNSRITIQLNVSLHLNALLHLECANPFHLVMPPAVTPSDPAYLLPMSGHYSHYP